MSPDGPGRGPDALEREVRHWRELRRVRPDVVEIPGPGQESVWDYPRPPRVEPATREVRVEWAGARLAQSARALRVLETAGAPVYYLPPDDVAAEWLEPATDPGSLCEWKGRARYLRVRVGAEVVERAAWSYPEPFEGYLQLRDWVAFYPGRVACWLGSERVRPQPGGFYGGWVTSDIVGPFKGAPGSESW